ncbi:TPA: ankyrin repeat domain-containing protein [Vibrio parahaemolyticus]|uniref:ankyrin repeat domain-containing protein n=1 Tax=Vibrio parahaemolyticus TaxID=670 RepID=UPI00079FDEE9|nr:ankyrin repeat domain-containing protein [Vibrio parahaemolyticus]EGQ9349504.1 ankyrin repeat domain-containing protein [Vibrio parahaemolyticus]EGQ9515090.1 ankyrin repeat domain-containing protein [Vibrio parahaemolyticus]EIM7929441.1 ankyrin repeat domain-containing protein [Vibrio parahaemolyticus]EJQ8019334.1 ankyrin repeat domain-containing protein [Vibrio parahaemolyticus]EJU8974514.1 ankyrin repeat domain-containing protein [Vibrio parahaemolyticus]
MKNVFLLSSVLFSLGLSFSLFASQDKLETQYQSLVELFFDAARIGNNEVVETFVSQGFPIDQRNNESYTALMVAAYQGNKDTVRLLLDSGANACLQDKRGNTALIKREISIAKDLYQAECSPDLRNKAGLDLKTFAEIYGQSEVLKSLQNK